LKILITGGCGFIGSHVLSQLLANGYAVKALRRPGSRPKIKLHKEPVWIEGDLVNCPEELFHDVDGLIHLAAAGVTALNDWDQAFRVNVFESLTFWRRAVESGIRNFIITGSCFEYGAAANLYDKIPAKAPLLPTGAYHASKAAATMAATALTAEHGLKTVVLRPFHIFGEGEAPSRFWPSLRSAALDGRDFPMTIGEQVRDFIPVETVAREYVEELEALPLLAPGKIKIRNLCSGQPTSLREFAQSWWTHWEAKGRLDLGRVPYREAEVMRYVGDPEKRALIANLLI
jgi:nucleoside-diphosphate-sugar epimerase